VDDDFVAAARALTGGKGPDLVVDSVGGRTLEGSIECAAYRGRIITVGGAGRDPKASPEMTVAWEDGRV
jgi:NADPH2:quinone reductase